MNLKRRVILVSIFALVLALICAPLLQFDLIDSPALVAGIGSLLFLGVHFSFCKKADAVVSSYSRLGKAVMDLVIMLIIGYVLLFIFQALLYLFEISGYSFSRFIQIFTDLFSGKLNL
jgi:hypothetical protein